MAVIEMSSVCHQSSKWLENEGTVWKWWQYDAKVMLGLKCWQSAYLSVKTIENSSKSVFKFKPQDIANLIMDYLTISICTSPPKAENLELWKK